MKKFGKNRGAQVSGGQLLSCPVNSSPGRSVICAVLASGSRLALQFRVLKPRGRARELRVYGTVQAAYLNSRLSSAMSISGNAAYSHRRGDQMRGSVRMMILASILAAFAMAPSAAKAQAGVEGTNAADSCVKAVGDINGDGLTDYAASPRVPHGSPVVYLLFGRSERSAAAPDARYIRRHAAVVLRGPTAVPFICANDTIRIASDIRLASAGVSKPKRRRTDSAIGSPASYTMIDLDPMMPAFSIGYSSSTKAINERGQIVGRFLPRQGIARSSTTTARCAT